MKVCIDARWIFPSISGIGAYTRALARHMANDPERVEDLLLLFSRTDLRDRTWRECALDGVRGVASAVVGYGPFSPRSQWDLPRRLRAWGVDVFHSPNFMIPLWGMPCPAVVTIHDMIPLKFPEFTPKAKKRRLLPLTRWIMRRAACRAAVILTVSRQSADDIVEILAIPPERRGRVVVIPNGVDDIFRRPRAGSGAASRGADRAVRLLFVGRGDPYKNLDAAVQALKILVDDRGQDAELVVVGGRDSRYPEPWRLAEKLGVAGRVRATGHLDEAELAEAYASADVLVAPSRYEGFGLPPLEAMASGLPVVCSGAGSLPEVVGDAALICDPDDPGTIADAVARIVADPQLRAALQARGRARADRFRWETAARSTLEIYRTLCPG